MAKKRIAMALVLLLALLSGCGPATAVTGSSTVAIPAPVEPAKAVVEDSFSGPE